MKAIEIKPGIYWVGAKDWSVRDFHGYKTQRGSTYNAFLIIDEKVTLVDTVKHCATEEMLSRIRSIIDPSKIDLVISNHGELDHSGALPVIMDLAKNATLVTSKRGVSVLAQHFNTSGWNIKPVNTGDELSLGKRTLKFLPIPMVHWPDSMATYIPEEKLLLPNDAFGQHLATDGLFDDEFPLDITLFEAGKYYANIVYPFGKIVSSVMDVVMALDIDMIAPSHGLIWRKHIPKIFEKYRKWVSGGHNNNAIVIYDTMWGSTETMAQTVRLEFERNDIKVSLKSLKDNHISDIMAEILEARYIAIGSATLNNLVLPSIAALMNYIRGLAPSNKVGFTFGSHGWYADGLKEITSVMDALKWEQPQPPVNIKFRPDEVALQTLRKHVKGLLH